MRGSQVVDWEVNEKRKVEEINGRTSRLLLLLGQEEMEEVEVLAKETGLKKGYLKVRTILC